ncbi:hypothetical protein NU10_04910 [Flavobacterium dauae]|uniref:hypothetical protein n=1 Tax=Flavobacterium dauae TaxID=1563479 RepID=UPI00101B42E2|nr:hypothetical protein [Flavobacterium dauae]WLD24729.1 hypothetical protein NU10_04910 [Flavobacterium dauae]
MFQEGTIIYFDPFYFKNGNTAKPKYFIVLKSDAGKQIIASLPTRKDSIPENETIKDGCIELPDINLNCFVISNSKIVTECGKHFDFTTHLYGHQIDDYDVKMMKEIYPNEGSDYIVWGKMRLKLFEELLNCLKYSKSVKRKYRNLL